MAIDFSAAKAGSFQAIGGISEMVKNLITIKQKARDAAAKALYIEAETIMTAAKRLTPVDTGTLRASGYVDQPEYKDGYVQVTLGFGGAAEDYAVIVHEDTTMQHPNGGQAKFLEDPLLKAADGMGARISAALDLEKLVGGA